MKQYISKYNLKQHKKRKKENIVKNKNYEKRLHDRDICSYITN